MEPIRALIVDDHPVTREGLRTALELSDDVVVVVGEASSGEEAVERARELVPDVVFMDVRMPGMDGIEATRRIRQAAPATKVILITIDESRGAISEAIQAGVSGYLLKDASPDSLVDAARNAIEGNAVIHPQLTKTFIEEVRLGEPDGPRTTPLSKREREILQKVADAAGGQRPWHLAAHGEDPPGADLRKTRSQRPSPGRGHRDPHGHRHLASIARRSTRVRHGRYSQAHAYKCLAV
jgi:two-component system, NarL family, response regulator LiaR